jgi:hypothetical protein
MSVAADLQTLIASTETAIKSAEVHVASAHAALTHLLQLREKLTESTPVTPSSGGG